VPYISRTRVLSSWRPRRSDVPTPGAGEGEEEEAKEDTAVAAKVWEGGWGRGEEGDIVFFMLLLLLLLLLFLLLLLLPRDGYPQRGSREGGMGVERCVVGLKKRVL